MGRPLGSKNAKIKRIYKDCTQCGTTFATYPYRIKTVKFCSRKCFNSSKIGQKLSEKQKRKLSKIRKDILLGIKELKEL